MEAFVGEVLVECPKCASQARLVADNRIRNLSCLGCGPQREYPDSAGYSTPKADPVDPRTGLRLWLQCPCGGQTVWALNWAQLDCLESYIRADLRPNRGFMGSDGVPQWRNGSYLNRLPTWMKLARNRHAILKSIERIRCDRASRT